MRRVVGAVWLLCSAQAAGAVTDACPDPVSLAYGTSCRCTAASCGTIPEPDVARLKAGQAFVVTSQGAPDEASFMVPEYVGRDAPGARERDRMDVTVNPRVLEQEIVGFGGAFTDAVAHLYSQFEPAVQEKFTEAHFGKGGLGYTVGRVNMNACDCSRMNYVYDTVENDYSLEHFCLRDDSAEEVPCGTDYKMTVIKAARDALSDTGANLKLFTSTWSAPTWYKNQNFTCAIDTSQFYPTGVCSPGGSEKLPTCSREVHWSETGATNSTWVDSHPLTRSNAHTCQTNANDNCYLTGFLREDEDAQISWALYFSKFISAYKDAGIDMWGLTVQNEPLATTCEWPGMMYTAEMQASFVKNHLGPTIRRDHPEVKIMIHDDDVTSLPEFAQVILGDPSAAEFVDGVAIHWYASFSGVYENDTPVGLVEALTRSKTLDELVDDLGFTLPTLGGGTFVKDTYKQLQAQSKDKFIMGTEATNGAAIGQGEWFGPSPGNWNYGYSYSHDILWQLKNGAAGWTDWNLMLDDRGGPNGWGNFLHPTVTSHNSTSFYQHPQFFHLAHFAKYVVPGSRQADISIRCFARHEEFCQSVAFINPEGNAVVVITNDQLVGIPMGSVLHGIPVVSALLEPVLAKGPGRALSWTIRCGTSSFSGSIPWKGIQTIVMPCESTEEVVV